MTPLTAGGHPAHAPRVPSLVPHLIRGLRVNRMSRMRWEGTMAGLLRRGALLALTLATMRTAEADALYAVQVLREGGCGGTQPAARALERSPELDRIAQLWASGRTLAGAAERTSYAGEALAGMHVRGSDEAMIEALRRAGACRSLGDRALGAIGLYRRAPDAWLIVGARWTTPPRRDAPVLASRVLELVNEARARGTRCGSRVFAPAPPVQPSSTLDGVALGHAADMAMHDYFEHEDLAGRSPADRVRAVGYAEKLVGENIAYGPKTADEVVQGWLDSPGHCENIMDPRFVEMGIAYAHGSAARRGLYWVQLLAKPRG